MHVVASTLSHALTLRDIPNYISIRYRSKLDLLGIANYGQSVWPANMQNSRTHRHQSPKHSHFSKALEDVNHSTLLTRILKMRVSTQVVQMTGAVLYGMSQSVALAGAISDSDQCTLISAFHRARWKAPSCSAAHKLHASSNQLYFSPLRRHHHNIQRDGQSHQLQGDLKQRELCEAASDMVFCPSKSEIICFSRKAGMATPSCYKLDTEAISLIAAIKYLGVHIQGELKWHQQIDYITDKAASTLSFIKRTIPPHLTNLQATACKQLIRPVLEYASFQKFQPTRWKL